MLAALFVSRAAAQDTVILADDGDARAQTRLTGRVVDYTGRELRLALPAGGERSIPAGQVVHIDTPTTQAHRLADELFVKGEFEPALAQYGRARNEDQRPWVRRRITAQMVRCHQALDQAAAAGEEFLLLLRSDPDTVHFDCIPLAWLPSQPPLELEQAARRWLDRQDTPAAVLLGASHLMSTVRPQALERLKGLAASADRRVAQLAIAQTWRAAAVTATEEEIDRWEQAIEQMPAALRAGPYFVLGSALQRRQQWERAALAWLRLPILYPEHRILVRRSLLDAGGALEKLQRSQQAAQLYRELLALGGPAGEESEARSRLEALHEATSRP